jgi:hypothetical protein
MGQIQWRAQKAHDGGCVVVACPARFAPRGLADAVELEQCERTAQAPHPGKPGRNKAAASRRTPHLALLY